MKLILFTTFYQGHAQSRYTQSLVSTAGELSRRGINWDYWSSHGDFHVDDACNIALAKFMNDADATDFLMIDSDESWKPQVVVDLLAHDVDAVAVAYRMKNQWDRYTCKLCSDSQQKLVTKASNGKTLAKADRIPGGFLRLRKAAVKSYADKYPERYQFEGMMVPIFFRAEIKNCALHSQDFNFSDRMRDAGVDLWIDADADISHFGMTEYPGNLARWFRTGIHHA